MSSQPFRFYAAEVSYFSAKVRPALRFKGIHYVELLPDYLGEIIPRTGLAFIPILVTPEDETLQDTSDILDALERRIPTPPIYPETPLQRLAAHLIELYADEFLLLPAMHYRWSFPESERKARGDFSALSGDPDRANRFADRMSGSLPALGITAATIPAIEAHTRELLDALSAHFSAQPFLFGERMSFADCALMGPLYGHLYLDAIPGKILRETTPRVCHWIQRMNHPDPAAAGAWQPGDRLAPTLEAILELIGRDAVPTILDNVAAFEHWADTRPANLEEPPRMVGSHRTSLRGVDLERATSSYSLWMLQRPLDIYRGLARDDRAPVEDALAGKGFRALLEYEPRHRLGKRRYRLVFPD